MPPSTKSSPSSSPIRRAVPASPSGPAAYERWSKRIEIIVVRTFPATDSGVGSGIPGGFAKRPLCSDPTRRMVGSSRIDRGVQVTGKTTAKRGSQSDVPVPTNSEAIRNVVLVGPSGSGKTTLVEALLVSANVINRAGAILDGTTVSDFDAAEPVSYTHLRAHETDSYLVCRLL